MCNPAPTRPAKRWWVSTRSPMTPGTGSSWTSRPILLLGGSTSPQRRTRKHEIGTIANTLFTGMRPIPRRGNPRKDRSQKVWVCRPGAHISLTPRVCHQPAGTYERTDLSHDLRCSLSPRVSPNACWWTVDQGRSRVTSIVSRTSTAAPTLPRTPSTRRGETARCAGTGLRRRHRDRWSHPLR